MSKQGKSSDKKKSGSFLSRLIVMAFGLAMVVLGSESLQKEHGGVMNYLKEQSRAFASQVKKEGRSLSEDITAIRDDAPITTLDVGKKGRRIGVEEPSAKDHKVDSLSEKDRNQLNQLLNGL